MLLILILQKISFTYLHSVQRQTPFNDIISIQIVPQFQIILLSNKYHPIR